MQLTAEELLQIITGEVSPERLRVLLDRLDDCPESEAALLVMITLIANRREALEILRLEELHALDAEPFKPE